MNVMNTSEYEYISVNIFKYIWILSTHYSLSTPRKQEKRRRKKCLVRLGHGGNPKMYWISVDVSMAVNLDWCSAFWDFRFWFCISISEALSDNKTNYILYKVPTSHKMLCFPINPLHGCSNQPGQQKPPQSVISIYVGKGTRYQTSMGFTCFV